MPPSSQPTPAASAMQARLRHKLMLWIALLWVFGLAVTAVLTLWLNSHQQERLWNQFDTEVARVTDDIERHLHMSVYGLLGARGVYAASDSVNRAEFRRYVQSRDLAAEFPGVQGMGFVQRVQRTELDTFIQRQQADGAPDFEVRSLNGDSADSTKAQVTTEPTTDLYIVKFIESLGSNRFAQGLDLGSDAVYREAAERAARTGQPALSGVVDLMQNRQPARAGFLWFVPVYQPGLPLETSEQRLAALQGLAFSPVILEELLRSGLGTFLSGGLHIQIAGQSLSQGASFFYQTGKPPARPVLSSEMLLRVHSNLLFVRAQSTPVFEATANRPLVFALGLAGALLSTLVAWVLWLQATGRAQTETRARQMTLDLQKLALVAERTSNVVLMSDTQMRITWVNEGFTRVYGYTAQEAMGRTPRELMGSDLASPDSLKKLQESVEQGVGCRVEIPNRAKDGRIYWLDIEVQPVHDNAGQLMGFVEIGLDTTQQRETNERLVQAILASDAQQQELDVLARVARETTNAVVLTDTEGLIVWVNAGFTRITGYTLPEALGQKPGWLLQCPQTDPQTVAHMREALAQCQPCQAEVFNRAKDGRGYWLELAIQPLFDAGGQHTGFMAIQSEVTERRESLNRLKSLVQENESLMGAINQATIYSVADLQGNIVDVNEAFVRISGYERAQLLGSNHRLLKSGTQPDAFWQDAWATIGSGQVWHGEVCNRNQNGELYWVDSTIVPFLGTDGLVEKYISIRTDITDQKRAQIELESQRKRLNNILKGTQAGTWERHVPSGRTTVNERWTGMLGYTLQELIPVSVATWTELVHPDDLQTSDAALQRHFRGETEFYESEVRMRHRNGHWVWILDRGQVVSREPDGSPCWMSGTHLDITERKEAENQLIESQTLFKGLLDVASDWYWETDEHHRFSNFVATHDTENYRALSQMNLGLRRWEMVDVTPLGTDWAEHIAVHERRESFRNFEYRRVLPSGEVRYYAISGFPVVDSFGKFRGYRGTTRDATAQKQQEAQLQTARDRLELATESAGIGVWILDVVHDTLEWDARMFQLYGKPFSQDTRAYDLWSSSLHPDDRASGTQAIADAISGKKDFDTEFRILWPDGTLRCLRGTARVQRDAQGHALRMVGVNFDVTEQRERERRIVHSEALLRGAIDAVDEAFVLYDPQDRLVFCNDKYRQTYPRQAHLMVPGATFEAIVRAAAEAGDFEPAIGRVDAWVAERMALHRQAHSDMLQKLSDGRTLRVIENRMADGHTVGFRIDITDLVNAREQAQAASRFKGEFLANMSHEIRTPMNAILGMLKLMHSTALQPRQLDYVQKTEGAAKSLLGLLNDILDFSKVEAGKMTLDLQPFGVDRLMRDLSVIFSANLGSKRVEVLFDIDPSLPRLLLGDSLRLQQILINLGGNAIKFTARGEVVVRVHLEALEGHGPDQQARVHFAVKDSGIGIAPENQDKIFAGFTQAEASTTRRFGGTGLGLSICRRLIDLMGGQLQLDSAVDQGSTFSFSLVLPVVQTADQTVTPQVAPAPWTTPGLPVLVVDDNPLARELMASMGDSLGWRLDTADSGEAALALIAERRAQGTPYQAVFVDWMMPGLDGWQTSARIRSLIAEASDATSSPLIMMVTAHGREMLSQQTTLVQNLIDGYLVKPVTASMLLEAMQLAVQPSDAAASARSSAPVAQPLAGLRILLVEDNAINQQVAEELLSGQGALIDIADNGLRGVQAVQSAMASARPYDAVLMDMQMPVMDGLAATRDIRGRLKLASLPIIAMTANALAGDRDVCLAAGMNDHVGKPFDLDRLVATLLQWTHGTSVADAPQAPDPAPLTGATEAQTATEETCGEAEPCVPALLNRQGAMQRVGGSTHLLNRLSTQFLGGLAAELQTCDGVSQPERRSEALRALHTLKGVAATIGADALAQAAGEAEQACRSGGEANLDRLHQVAAQTRAALGHIGITAAPAPVSTAPTDGAGQPHLNPAQRDMLARLLPLLEASDMSVFDVMEELRAQDDAERWAVLDNEVQAMAFERAAQLVRQWQHAT